jgi:hypothetical protein
METSNSAGHLAFKGWVPNLDGSISFSTFGAGMSGAGIQTCNVGGFDHRFVISVQRKNLMDALFPPLEVLERFFDTTGVFYLICAAETSGQAGKTSNTLNGILCMVRDIDWRDRVEGMIRDAVDQLSACQREFPQLDDSDHVKNGFRESYSSLVELLRRWSDYSCDFSLPKTGIATLTAPAAWRWQKSEQTSQGKFEESYVVCSQLFYFLKDLGHRHQHHSPRTDTICDLYPKGDDIRWKFATFRRIYLKITDYEWRKSEEVYFSTLGILSYLRSFYDIVKPDLASYDLVDKAIVPLDNLELSIKARQKTMNQEVQAQIARVERFRNLMIGVLGLILSFISLSQLVKNGVVPITQVSPLILYADRLILQSPQYFWSIVGAIVAIGTMGIYRQRLLESQWAYSVTRAVQGLSQTFAALMLVLLILIICVAWYYLYGLASAFL